MKIQRALYNDDGIDVPGFLVERFLRKPVFYSADNQCGWDTQIIEKTDWCKVTTPSSSPTVVDGERSDRVRPCIKPVEESENE